MKEFDIKKGHFKNIEGEKLKDLLKSRFGEVKTENDKLLAHYGALQPLTTWVKSKDTLCVDTKMSTDLTDDVINETIRLYNQFLEDATGFNSKERVKRSKKKSEGK